MPPRLEISIRAHLAPVLRKDGFLGSGRTFRRVQGDLVQVINIQGSRYGGEFAVNLAIQPLAIPDGQGNTPDPKKILEYQCELRRRMTESGADQWWKHGDSQEGMDNAVKAATDVYERIRRQLFERMSGPASPLYTMTPKELESSREPLNGFGTTAARLALVLGRMRKVAGNQADATAFAECGLRCISERATLLRHELECLYAST